MIAFLWVFLFLQQTGRRKKKEEKEGAPDR
jgi:hypothetical protein